MKINEVSFSDAIRDTKPASRTLLLGNGFSISLCESFAYEHLYDKAKNPTEHWACCIGSHLDNLFSNLKTSDFEMVLAHLNIAIKVAECYSMNLEEKNTLIDDRNKLIDSFLSAISSVHPPYKTKIADSMVSCINFLSNFKKIFTTNYDLLLYWLINEKEHGLYSHLKVLTDSVKTIPFDDGFKKCSESNRTIWDGELPNDRQQNIFYLHGSLFINDIEGPIKKFVYQEGSSILIQLKDWLQSDKKPLIVLEGNPKDKLKLINTKPYLLDCLRRLKRVNDDLFILGFSVNEKADKHIIDKIQESNIKRIFLSFHERYDDEFIEKAKKLTHIKRSKEERPVFIFNAKDATTWKTIKLDN